MKFQSFYSNKLITFTFGKRLSYILPDKVVIGEKKVGPLKNEHMKGHHMTA